MSTQKITFCLNWQAAPYHIPIYLAKTKGYFDEEGLDIAILEPSNPSDVTELIGSGKIDMGLKAMIHTLAAKARGFPVTSVASLLDEPFTGVLYLKSSGITNDFQTIKGKKIGYVGEFGKIQLDELTKYHGLTKNDYTAVRCGMNVAKYIIEGKIDGGIGIECMQQVELEQYCRDNGLDETDVDMMRIDRVACLGCCCFCTILYICNDEFLKENPEKVKKFLKAIKKATNDVIENPEQSWKEYIDFKPQLNNELSYKQFQRCFAYFSSSLFNVHRDWNKVTNYGKRLDILPTDYQANYTNEYVPGVEPKEVDDPIQAQNLMAAHQDKVRLNGGFSRLNLN
ncbi:glycylpeptide N-tetradecanoyltransferase [Pichia californica]|uniref:4-amino-5-hydroxymethyl-2-methylpyrimidine phosphate synthase n=1 Tax=Pichia californica TaxID=460514 RepID=A0A9P6WGZ8_9ASCO|nr:glycylpeptide N-tetradecanoyltransferase [[Candida] californica]